jgi:hypothetical protein
MVLGVGLLLGPLGAGAQFLAFAEGFGARHGGTTEHRYSFRPAAPRARKASIG